MSYPGEPEPGITGVSLQTETKYNILWNNPVPIDTPNSIPLSYWADSGGATTHVNVVPLRNRSEFTGSTVPYTVHPTRQNYNPETQNPIPNVTASPPRGTPPGVGPASGWLRVPAQQNQADPYGTGVIDAPPNSHAIPRVDTPADGEAVQKTIVVNLPYIVGQFTTWPVLPANGGTGRILCTVGREANLTVRVEKANQAKLGATMLIHNVYDEGPEFVVDRDPEHALPEDATGFVTLDNMRSYEIELTGEYKDAQANWDDVLIKENVKLQFYKADKQTTVADPYKFTVFWVKLDVDPALLKNGDELDPAKQLPPHPGTEYTRRDAYGHLHLYSTTFRQAVSEIMFTDHVGRQINSHEPPDPEEETDWRSGGVICVRGTIRPSGMDGKDFATRDLMIGQDVNVGFNFRRLAWLRSYFGDNGDFAEAPISTEGRNNADAWLDERINDENANYGEDDTPDRDGSVNDLFIYHVDTPSSEIGMMPLAGDILRDRYNMMEFVYYNAERCSDGNENNPLNEPGYKWSANFSTETQAHPNKPGENMLVENATYNNNGDNKVIAGSWPATPRTYNLAGDTTPDPPFNPQVFTVDKQNMPNAREKIDFDIILQAGNLTRKMLITGEDFPTGEISFGFTPTNWDPNTGSAAIGVLGGDDKPHRDSVTLLTATFDFTANGVTKPGDYRIKTQIGDTAVVLLAPQQWLHVIGRAVPWDQNLHFEFIVDNAWSVYVELQDGVGNPAKGDDVIIEDSNQKENGIPDPTAIHWMFPTIQVEKDGDRTGRFARNLVILKPDHITFFKVSASGGGEWISDNSYKLSNLPNPEP